MRRGDLAIGVVIGLFVLGAAGIYFYKANASKQPLVALEMFDKNKQTTANAAGPKPDNKPDTPQDRPRNVTIPPVVSSEQRRPVVPAIPPSLTPRHDGSSSRPTTGELANNVRRETNPPAAPPNPMNPPAAHETPVNSQPPILHPQPNRNPPPTINTPTSGQPKLPLTHTVEAGESLTLIAQRYYNNPRMVPLIQKANPEIKDINNIRPGMKLLIPDRANPATRPAIAQKPDVHPSRPEPHDISPGAPLPNTYTVKSGDTLIGISGKFYGDRRHAKAIHELNRTTIGADPNALRPGMVLKLPPRTPASQPHAPSRR